MSSVMRVFHTRRFSIVNATRRVFFAAGPDPLEQLGHADASPSALRRGQNGLLSTHRPHRASRLTIQNCQSRQGMAHDSPASRMALYVNSAKTYAIAVMYTSCRMAHFQLPVSRRVTASVGRHCIAST